ncbi:MAG: hypothetical protein GY947_06065 [Rhodobacteraceae bacterium]|nr:hypothetical protein [Paracoccaceae bacterium]
MTNQISPAFGFLEAANLFGGAKSGLMSAAHVNGIMMDAVLSYNSEILDFIKYRLNEDSTTAQHLMACKTTEELVSETSEYLTKIWSDYPSEVAKLANIGIAQAGQVVERLQEETVAAKFHLVEDLPMIAGNVNGADIDESLANVPV